MKTKAKRKLLAPKVLDSLCSKVDQGVPVSRCLRDLSLDISRTQLVKLIDWYNLHASVQTSDGDINPVRDSLFPSWLSQDSEKVQEQPDGWAYSGRFPWGEWVHDENN